MIILCQVSLTSYISYRYLVRTFYSWLHTCRYKVPNSATWHFLTCVTTLNCPIKYFLYKMIFLITINVRPIWWDIFSVFIFLVIFLILREIEIWGPLFWFFFSKSNPLTPRRKFLKTSCNFFPWNQFHEIIFKQYYVRTNCVKSIFIYIPQRTE